MDSSYSDIYWILQQNALEVKFKLLVFSFVPFMMMWKLQKVESVNKQSNCEISAKREQTHSVCLHAVTQWKTTKVWRALIHIMITKQQVKNEQIKRKQTCFESFLKVQILRK